jgi:short-chain fatty acids transporter
MLPRLGHALSALFRATAPDPFVLAIALSALAFLLAALQPGFSAADALDSWANGLWQPSLLAFALQMCLILVTGHVLASTKPVSALLSALASTPRSGRQAVALTAGVSICFGLINWGLGLIVGALLARDVGRAMRRRNIPVPYPLLAAAGYMALLCWHGGLSASAPLQAATADDLRALIGDDTMTALVTQSPLPDAAENGPLPATATIFTRFNAITSGGLLLIAPALLALMCPRTDPQGRPLHPIADCVTDASTTLPEPRDHAAQTDADRAGAIPDFLDRSPVFAWLLAAPVIVYLAIQLAAQGLAALTLNTAILAFFGAGLILHASPARYMASATDAATGCAGVLVQFPLYFGILALMRDSGLAADVSDFFARASGGSEGGLAIMTFLSAGLVNLFVPSGGGQWAIQAPIALSAAADSGADAARVTMAVAYGDQWTNMLQPFWALPLLGITGCRARDIVGYTSVILVAAGLWFVACLLLL